MQSSNEHRVHMLSKRSWKYFHLESLCSFGMFFTESSASVNLLIFIKALMNCTLFDILTNIHIVLLIQVISGPTCSNQTVCRRRWVSEKQKAISVNDNRNFTLANYAVFAKLVHNRTILDRTVLA